MDDATIRAGERVIRKAHQLKQNANDKFFIDNYNPDGQHCGNCKFWLPGRNPGYDPSRGKCRAGSANGEEAWRVQWCGNWAQRLQSQLTEGWKDNEQED